MLPRLQAATGSQGRAAAATLLLRGEGRGDNPTPSQMYLRMSPGPPHISTLTSLNNEAPEMSTHVARPVAGSRDLGDAQTHCVRARE